MENILLREFREQEYKDKIAAPFRFTALLQKQADVVLPSETMPQAGLAQPMQPPVIPQDVPPENKTPEQLLEETINAYQRSPVIDLFMQAGKPIAPEGEPNAALPPDQQAQQQAAGPNSSPLNMVKAAGLGQAVARYLKKVPATGISAKQVVANGAKLRIPAVSKLKNSIG